ncbi:MAG: hypothetical protein A3F70_17820 [Acidobacteria bacterium RIFCSPLOWO2_12_FULL_67_14]|nr:MAG: hypothetical protein A3F70_17820 [Acidobacteria bacterium RIFCSPLOWO2_12_FULL_67_14]
MKRVLAGILTACVLAAVLADAQALSPYKLGTFARGGRPLVGIVLKDSLVIDFAAAHQAVRASASVAAPTDMRDLIARYDAGLRGRIAEIIRAVESAGTRPAYVYDVKALKILPPIMYPRAMLNVAVNYREHDREMGGTTLGAAPQGTQSAPGIWQRPADDKRWNPYMFLKSPTTIIAEGEPIRLPPGRTQVDWECELGVVIGREARRVPAAKTNEFIFGYTVHNDVSDRGGRGDTRMGSDWLISKNHDTFGPLGPFITPKQFVADPHKLKVRFALNGKVLQEADTSYMIHTVHEQVEYGSNIMTLRPGDLIATGTPAGVGSARKPPIYFKPGDTSACTYEGIGTLTNPVVGS